VTQLEVASLDGQVTQLAAVPLERADELAGALAQRPLTQVTSYVDVNEMRDDCRVQLRPILPALRATPRPTSRTPNRAPSRKLRERPDLFEELSALHCPHTCR
jgi:hypothetical protein